MTKGRTVSEKAFTLLVICTATKYSPTHLLQYRSPFCMDIHAIIFNFEVLKLLIQYLTK